MDLPQAKKISRSLIHFLAQFCDRIEIAGSVRREKPTVKDIELIVIPKVTYYPDMFGAMSPCYPINLCQWDKIGFLVKGGNRYKKISTIYNINLDLFIIRPPSQWGVQFAIRTGPASFSKKIVTQRRKDGLLPSDCLVHDGGVYRHGKLLPMPEEQDFFDFLGIDFIEPKMRSAFH